MCTCDGAPWIDDQLASIAAQTALPAEVVVCDDASTDDTVARVAAFAARVPFPVRVHVNARRLGVVANFEQAIGRCEGDAIALADQDDVWRPDKLALLAGALRRRGVGLAFSDAELVDADLQPLGMRAWEVTRLTGHARRALARGAARGYGRLANQNAVTGATVAFRAAHRDVVCPFPPFVGTTEVTWMLHDWWIVLAVGFVATMVPVADPLVRYRQHAGQQSGLAPEGGRRSLADRRALLGERLDRLAVVRAELARRAPSSAAGPAARTGLDDLERHLRSRADLAESSVRRLGAVAGELLSGRYRAFSMGWRSAGSDLLLR
jgi:glycosyltransferase involved in cell wall biosynthesis